jgi:hypothetical protein
MQKYTLLLIAVASVIFHCGCKRITYINPQGTYVLNKEINRDSLPIYNYFGDIQVQTISKEKVAVTFFICSGATHYYIGTFIDTLDYRWNKMEYSSKNDPKCMITLNVSTEGISSLETKNQNEGCAFGNGIDANQYFEKISNERPNLIDPKTGEKIK